MKKYTPILLLVLVFGSLLFGGYQYRDKKLLEDELSRQYRTRELEFERQLKTSESLRLAANHRYDSLDSVGKIIATRDSLEIASLKSIPGKFKSLTSKQLEEKMNEEYRLAQ